MAVADAKDGVVFGDNGVGEYGSGFALDSGGGSKAGDVGEDEARGMGATGDVGGLGGGHVMEGTSEAGKAPGNGGLTDDEVGVMTMLDESIEHPGVGNGDDLASIGDALGDDEAVGGDAMHEGEGGPGEEAGSMKDAIFGDVEVNDEIAAAIETEELADTGDGDAIAVDAQGLIEVETTEMTDE